MSKKKSKPKDEFPEKREPINKNSLSDIALAMPED